MGLSWELIPINWTPLQVPALVGAAVGRYNLGWDQCLRTVVCCPEAIPPYFAGSISADGDDVLIRRITATANVGPVPQAEATMAGLTGSAFLTQRTAQWEEFDYLQIDKSSHHLEDCEFHGQSFNIDLSHAIAAWSAELGGACELLVDLNWTVAGERGGGNTCICQVPPFPQPLNPGRVIRNTNHVVVTIEVTYEDSSASTEVVRGIHALDSGLTRTRLGFFSHPAFDGQENEESFTATVVGFVLPVTLDLEHAVRVQISGTVECFSEFNGQLTPSSDTSNAVCWSDRVLFATSFGSTFNDMVYNPRADFDLDGDVDSEDYSAFLEIFNQVACVADFNCDGAVDVSDIFAFQTAWFANKFVADFDGNELIEISDIFGFLAAWFSGC